MLASDPSSVTSFRQTPNGDLVAALERLASTETITQVVETLRQVSRRLVGSDGIAIVLREGNTCHYVEEDAVGPLWKGGRFPISACVSGWTMVNRKAAIIPDIFLDERIPHDLYRGTFVRSLAMVPIRERDPLGAIGAYWANRYVPSPEEIGILRSLARVSAGAVERLRLIATLSSSLAETELARDELRHRVKNAFVSAQAIARLTLPQKVSTPFAARLAALARAHDLIDQSAGTDCAIVVGSLLSAELNSYAVSSSAQLSLEGPVVQLPARKATALGLAINELATNALKYGALSTPEGRLEVRWRVEGGVLMLDWRESDGPKVSAGTTENVGSQLLKRLVEDQLGGSILRELFADGVICTIEIPMDDRVAASARPA